MVMACVGTQIHGYISVSRGLVLFDSPSSVKLLGVSNPRGGGQKRAGAVTEVVDMLHYFITNFLYVIFPSEFGECFSQEQRPCFSNLKDCLCT